MQLLADQPPKAAPYQLIPTDIPSASQVPYRVVVSPNTKLEFMTWGIVPTLPKPKGTSAISLAKYFGQLIRKTKGQRMGIFVFNDVKAANVFKAFQSRRQGRPLREVDFVSLKSLWPKTLAYYEFNRGQERAYYPYNQPDRWWRIRR